MSNGRSRGLIVLVVTGAIVAGCTTVLPEREANAFRDLSKADSTALGTMADARISSWTDEALAAPPEDDVVLTVQDCARKAEKDKPCVLVAKGSANVVLNQQAPEIRKLIAAVAAYGDAMANLAEAKDVAAAQAEVDAVNSAIGKLLTLTGVGAPAAAIPQIAAAVTKSQMMAARRKALLDAANQAKPGIDASARLLHEVTDPMRENLLDTADSRLKTERIAYRDADKAWKTLNTRLADPTLREADRSALHQAMLIEQLTRQNAGQAVAKAAADVQAARDMKTDFKSLADAHDKLIAALNDPKTDLKTTFDDLGTWLDITTTATKKKD